MGPDNNWCSQCGRSDGEAERYKKLLVEAIQFGLSAAEEVLQISHNYAWKGLINRLKAIGAAVES